MSFDKALLSALDDWEASVKDNPRMYEVVGAFRMAARALKDAGTSPGAREAAKAAGEVTFTPSGQGPVNTSDGRATSDYRAPSFSGGQWA
jgi:hypothetical protein